MPIRTPRFIDKTRSDIVWEKSIPDDGVYVFRNDGKVYLKGSDYDDTAGRPEHVCLWQRYDKVNDYAEMREWQRTLDAECITVDDPYWPEGISPNLEGHYVRGDSIAMKIKTNRWIQKRVEDVNRFDKNREKLEAGFANTVSALGSAYVPNDSGKNDERDEEDLANTDSNS